MQITYTVAVHGLGTRSILFTTRVVAFRQWHIVHSLVHKSQKERRRRRLWRKRLALANRQLFYYLNGLLPACTVLPLPAINIVHYTLQCVEEQYTQISTATRDGTNESRCEFCYFRI